MPCGGGFLRSSPTKPDGPIEKQTKPVSSCFEACPLCAERACAVVLTLEVHAASALGDRGDKDRIGSFLHRQRGDQMGAFIPE